MKKMIKQLAVATVATLLLSTTALTQGAPTSNTGNSTLTLYGLTVGGKTNLPACKAKDSNVGVEELCIFDLNETVSDLPLAGTHHTFLLIYPSDEIPKEWVSPIGIFHLNDQGIVAIFTFVTRGASVQEDVQALITQQLGIEPNIYRKLLPSRKLVDENGKQNNTNVPARIFSTHKPNSIYAVWNHRAKIFPQRSASGKDRLITVFLDGDIKNDDYEHSGLVTIFLDER